MCVVCLCVSSSGCSVGVLFSGLFSVCPVSWFLVRASLVSLLLGFLFLGCVSCMCCVLSPWFAVCLCCGVCFISVSVVYGVFVFVFLLRLCLVLVGTLLVAYCLLSIGLLFFCVLSVVGFVFVVGWLVVYCVCVWGDFCVVLLVFLFLFCGVAQVVFAFWVCVFGVCFGVAGCGGVFWGWCSALFKGRRFSGILAHDMPQTLYPSIIE